MEDQEFYQEEAEIETEVELEPEVEIEAEPEPNTEDENQASTPEEAPKRDSDFARMRRSMEEQFKTSTEYRLAQRLADKYGVSVEDMMERLEAQELEEQAKKENVPPERLRKEREQEERIQRLEEERTRMFVERQVEDFRSKNPDVKDNEMVEALKFLGKAHRLGESEMTLDQAFRAVNPSYETSLRDRIRQEILEEMSQTKAPIVTKGTSPAPAGNRTAHDLSDDEFNKLISDVKSGKRITKF